MLHNIHLLSFETLLTDIIRDFIRNFKLLARSLYARLHTCVYGGPCRRRRRGKVWRYNSCLVCKLNKLETCCRARSFARCRGTRTRLRVPCDFSSPSQLLPSVANGTAGTLWHRRFHLLVNVSRQKPQLVNECMYIWYVHRTILVSAIFVQNITYVVDLAFALNL